MHSSEITEYFNGSDNHHTPYLYRGKNTRVDLSDAAVKVAILMLDIDGEKICTKRPNGVMENAGFVVDRGALKDKDDWLVTDVGSFRNLGNSCKIATVKNGAVTDVVSVTGRGKKKPVLQADQYSIKTVYWRHYNERHRDFRRMSTTITKCTGEELPLGLLEYYFLHEEHSVSPHKNKRSGKPYHPTAPSTKKLIQEKACGTKGPTTIFSEATSSAGGVLNCETTSDLPRNVDQVKYARKKLNKQKNESEFMSLLDMSVQQSYIKGLQWTPQPRLVFLCNETLEQIVEICCQPDSAIPLCIDTTFNIGKLFVTSTVYQNPKIIDRRTGKFANIPGPAMFHTTETKEDFVYFSHTLLEQNRSFDNLRFLGSDRGKSLMGFIEPLKGTILIPCTKHVQDDIKRKLSSIGITGDLT